MKTAKGEIVWLGGTKVSGDWNWLDGTPWSFERWDVTSNMPGKITNHDCLVTNPYTVPVSWWSSPCSEKIPFICKEDVIPPTVENKSKLFVLSNPSLWQPIYHVWWNFTYDEREVRNETEMAGCK